MILNTNRKLLRKEALDDSLAYEKEHLDTWLFGHSKKVKEETGSQHYKALSGPGQIAKLDLLKGKTHCFLHKEAPKESEKPKILIANALLKDRSPSVGELALISALTEHYEVYLWEGTKHNLQAQSPLTHGSDFWRERKKIQPATEAQIKTFMTQQQMATSEWFILDHSAYAKRWGVPRFKLDLEKVRLNTPEQQKAVLDSVDASEITTIQLIAPRREMLTFVIKHFPRLNTLEIDSINGTWLEKNIDCLKGSVVKKMILSNHIEDSTDTLSILLEDTYGLEDLVILNDVKYIIIGLLNSPDTDQTPEKKLNVEVRPGSLIKFTENISLHYMTQLKWFQDYRIKELWNDGELTKKNLFSLKIENFDPSKIQADDLKKIINLELFSRVEVENSLVTDVLKNYPNIKFLELELSLKENKINLSHPSLESIKIIGCSTKKIEYAIDCPKLMFLYSENAVVSLAKPLSQLKILETNDHQTVASVLKKSTTIEKLNYTNYDNDETESSKLTINDSISELELSHSIPIKTGKSTLHIKSDSSSIIDITRSPELETCLHKNSIINEDTKSHPQLRLLTSSDLNPSILPEECITLWTSTDSELKIIPDQKVPEQKDFSGTTYFSLSLESSPDVPKKELNIFKDKKGFKASLKKETGEEISIRNYRILIRDQIDFDEKADKLIFKTTSKKLTEKNYLPIQFSLKDRPNRLTSKKIRGSWEGELESGKDYPLAFTAPVGEEESDFNVYADFPKGTEVGYYRDPVSQHYFIRLLKSPKDQTSIFVKLFYDFVPKSNYISGKIPFSKVEFLEIKSKENHLPDALRKKLNVELKKIPALNFLFETELSFTKKIQKLQEFCAKFEDESLETLQAQGTLSLLLDIIKAGRGVCRHRSQIFMLLALYAGAEKVQIVENEIHAYCEIQNSSGDWLQVKDLGGGAGKDALVEERSKDNLLPEETLKDSLEIVQNPESKETAKIKEATKKEEENAILGHLSQREPFKLESENFSKPRLLYLPTHLSVDQARDDCMTYLKANKELPDHYLYIHHPEDLKRYLDTYVLDEKGQRKQTPGPLRQIFEKGGLLFINWSNFSFAQRLHYQSLYAEICQLGDITAKKPVRVIGFLKEGTSSPLEFTRHFTVCDLPKTSPGDKKSSKPISKKSTPTPLEIDLFASTDWQEQLIADVKFSEEGCTLIEGHLLKAIREKRPLVIHRPPKDTEFDLLLTQIQIEGRFYFEVQGKWIEVPKEFYIQVLEQPLKTSSQFSEEQLFQCVGNTAEVKGEKIYLHLNNWYTLYEEIQINEKGILITQPGKLAKAEKNEKPVIFYVTQTIPETEWQRLAVYFQKNSPKQKYIFQLAPGVKKPQGVRIEEEKFSEKICSVTSTLKAEDLAKELKSDTEKNIQPSLSYVSNDPSYLSEILGKQCAPKEKFVILDLNPDMSVSDLIWNSAVETKGDKAKDKGLPHFRVDKGFLLKALEEGKTVILKGQLNPNLLQELLPLFSEDPYLEFNGKHMKVKGRVILVQPKSNDPLSPLLSTRTCDFTPSDYHKALLSLNTPEKKDSSKEDTEASKKIDLLVKFFERADYPHRGRAMPAHIGMTWRRLVKIKQLLETQRDPIFHAHNPIKGLMWGDYTKDSAYYAFLNVLYKFLLDHHSEQPVRLEKYHRLRQKIETEGNGNQQNFIWQLLNTCNGDTLRSLLGKDWLEKNTGLLFDYFNDPEISKEINQTLENHIKKFVIPEKVKEKKNKKSQNFSEDSTIPKTKSLTKMQERLQKLIEDEHPAKIVVIKGDPGVGKTHYLNGLKDNKNYECYQGLSEIESWLTNNSSNGKPKLLLIDEANTFKPGELDFLEGLHRIPPNIFYRGKLYPLTSQHKVVAAVNPEYFSGRNYHDILRYDAETVLARMPSPDYLVNWLVTNYGIKKDFAEKILTVSEIFKTHQPLAGYSFRDLQSVMQRYHALSSENTETVDSLVTLHRALYGEFGLRLADEREKAGFKTDLTKALFSDSPKLKQKTDTQGFHIEKSFFPSEMSEAQEALTQALAVRAQVQQQYSTDQKKNPTIRTDSIAYKRGLLLQGEPGLGKSTLYEETLKKQGLIPYHIQTGSMDAKKHYRVVTAGEPGFKEIGKQAFEAGAILIIKKLNWLSPDDERYLGGLLMGVHDDKPAKNPGFLVLGQQNGSEAAGGGALSPALCNRMQIVHIPPYSESSLIELAEKQLPSDQAKAFVSAFLHPKNPYPHPLTLHDFFDCLKKRRVKEETYTITRVSESRFSVFNQSLNSNKHSTPIQIENEAGSKNFCG